MPSFNLPDNESKPHSSTRQPTSFSLKLFLSKLCHSSQPACGSDTWWSFVHWYTQILCHVRGCKTIWLHSWDASLYYTLTTLLGWSIQSMVGRWSSSQIKWHTSLLHFPPNQQACTNRSFVCQTLAWLREPACSGVGLTINITPSSQALCVLLARLSLIVGIKHAIK